MSQNEDVNLEEISFGWAYAFEEIQPIKINKPTIKNQKVKVNSKDLYSFLFQVNLLDPPRV